MATTRKKIAKPSRAPAKKPLAKTSKPGVFDFAAVESALLDAARSAFTELRETYPKRRFYCMALYTAGGFGYVAPTAMSEEGLAEVARAYKQKPRYQDRTLAELRAQLRWSPDDSPHHDELDFEDVPMAAVATALQAIDHSTSWDAFHAFVAQVFDMFVRVLQQLDREGLFGTGKARDKIFVSVLMGDQDDSVLEVGKRVNPPAALALYPPRR